MTSQGNTFPGTLFTQWLDELQSILTEAGREFPYISTSVRRMDELRVELKKLLEDPPCPTNSRITVSQFQCAAGTTFSLLLDHLQDHASPKIKRVLEKTREWLIHASRDEIIALGDGELGPDLFYGDDSNG